MALLAVFGVVQLLSPLGCPPYNCAIESGFGRLRKRFHRCPVYVGPAASDTAVGARTWTTA